MDQDLHVTIAHLATHTEADIAEARATLFPLNPVLRDHYGVIVVSGGCPFAFTIDGKTLTDCRPAASPVRATVFYSDANAATAAGAMRDRDGQPVDARLVPYPQALRDWLPQAESALAEYRKFLAK